MKISPWVLLGFSALACAACAISWKMNLAKHGAEPFASSPATPLPAVTTVAVQTKLAPPIGSSSNSEDEIQNQDPSLRITPSTVPARSATSIAQPVQIQTKNSASLPPATLAERAQRVEDEANRELERLVPLLNLSEEQQDRVFSKLAQNSMYWSAGMAAGNAAKTPSTTPTVTKSIPDLLTSSDGGKPILTVDQEKTIVQDDLDRRIWWDEVMGLIKTNMDKGTTATSTSAGATATATATSPAVNTVEEPIADKAVEGADRVVD